MKRMVAGPRAVLEALRGRDARSVAVVWVDRKNDRALREVLDAAKHGRVPVEERARAELDELAGDVRHQGVIAVGGEYAYAELEDLMEAAGPGDVLVAVDQVTDPHNFGAIVRSSVAFGAVGVITTKDRAAPVTPVTVRASAGATEHARIARVTNLARALSTLADANMRVLGLAGEADTDLRDLSPDDRPTVLVVGSEGKGLRRLVRERCELLVRIPLPGPIASLNASVAAAIALYQVSASGDR